MGGDIENIEGQFCIFIRRVNYRLPKSTCKSELVEYIWSCAAELGYNELRVPDPGKYRRDDPGLSVEMVIHPHGGEFFSRAHALKGVVSILQVPLFLKWHYYEHVR